MKTRAESAEVFYPGQEPVVADLPDMEVLKRAAQTSPKKRARICTHAEPTDGLHEMLIVLSRASYVRPHRHLGKSESFTILEGEADVVLFETDGTIRRVISMGVLGSGKPFYYRLSEPIFHTVILRSENLVYHEVTGGPFRREQTEFASWAPAENNAAAIATFVDSLHQHAAGIVSLVSS